MKPSYNIQVDVSVSVTLYLVVTFLITVGTLHSLLSVCIVVHQKPQQSVLWWEGIIPFKNGCVSVGNASSDRLSDMLSENYDIYLQINNIVNYLFHSTNSVCQE